jgi:sarcosine oxidase, subunit delta
MDDGRLAMASRPSSAVLKQDKAMFQIECPNCGVRGAGEFRYGGEVNARPDGGDEREWAAYLYARQNVLGAQSEWWFHRMGCRRWFLARRHTLTNEVLETRWP